MNKNRILVIIIYCIIFSSSLLGDSEKTKFNEEMIDSLNVLSKKFPERAIRFSRDLLSKLDPNESVNLEHRIYNTLGEIFLDLGMFAQAMSSFTDAKVIQERLGKKSPWIVLNIGNVYYQQEKYIKAREKYYESLDIFNSFSNISRLAHEPWR